MYRNHPLIICSRTLALFLVGLLVIQSVRAQDADRSFTLETEDGITIYGDLYEPENVKRPPLILAFHQAGGDGRGEYAPIVPRLVSKGYAVMTIDQRSGGDSFGGVNRTMTQLGNAKYSYCEAYPDLEATLEYARRQGFGRIIVWGSSYSAALVIRLGADHPETVDRVLAFSPASGDAMGDCGPIEPASRLNVPALMLRPAREAAMSTVAADLKTYRDQGHATYISEGGSHGSSILIEDRGGEATEMTWIRVLEFLKEN